MSEKKISYLNRTFEDYQKSLMENIRKYYPQIANDFNDASIGSWLIDALASIGDNLSFYIDKAYNETNIDSAQQSSSIYSIARSNGLKIPGPKAAMAEETFTITLPVSKGLGEIPAGPNYFYAPIIKKGTQISNGSQVFEVMDDIDFSEDFNSDGEGNRIVQPNYNVNQDIISYDITKTEVVSAGVSHVYKQIINSNDIKPFMEIVIPETNIMEIESIIFKDGVDYNYTPKTCEFMMQKEYVAAADSIDGTDTYRFFEVESLVDQYRWGDALETTVEGNQSVNQPVQYTYGYTDDLGNIIPTSRVTKGRWVPLTRKFITEFTDKGYLKIIFGSGESAMHEVDYNTVGFTAQNQISKMIRNNFLGKLPQGGWTMFVSYRVNGGSISNVPADSIKQITNLKMEMKECLLDSDDKRIAASVRESLRVTNTTPSVSGKDIPTIDEIKAMIKYNNGAQRRCVTLKDYNDRIMQMPARYGSPFRVSTLEANNKVMIYMLSTDANGYLSDVIPELVVKNIQNYLSMYRTLNDYVEMKSGRIVNLSFEVDLFVDKNYNAGAVVGDVISVIKNYMDINKHQLGEDIYVSDIEKEISKVDGVLSIIDLRIYNEHDSSKGYSETLISQPTKMLTNNDGEYMPDYKMDKSEIDLDYSDYILKSEADEMFEIKYPDSKDIQIRVKTR